MPGMDWDEVEKRMRQEADDEEAQKAADRLSEIIADDVKGILSMSEAQLRQELIKDFGLRANSPEFLGALEDYRKAIKAAEGGLFSSPDLEKARKIIKGNQHLDNVNDKKKSWWDCGVIVITGLFVTLTGAIYGAVELFG